MYRFFQLIKISILFNSLCPFAAGITGYAGKSNFLVPIQTFTYVLMIYIKHKMPKGFNIYLKFC